MLCCDLKMANWDVILSDYIKNSNKKDFLWIVFFKCQYYYQFNSLGEETKKIINPMADCYIKVNGQKMSKSLGNSLLLKDLLDKYSAETVKFALLSTNYRGDINVTDNLFPDAQKHLVDFYTVYVNAKNKGVALKGEYKEIDDEFNSAMSDDFNTALALSNLFKYFKLAKSSLNSGDIERAGAVLNQIKNTYSLLGLFEEDAKWFVETFGEKGEDVPNEVKLVAEERWTARLEKNWAKSDELRAKLLELGYVVKDSKDGYTLEKK